MSTASPVIRVSAGVLVDEQGCALVVRKRGATVFQQPGGKPEPGESAVDALLREVHEEVGVVLDAATIESLGTFEAEAANEPGHVVVGDAFRARIARADVRLGAEIEDARWIRPEDVPATPLANLSRHHLIAFAWE